MQRRRVQILLESIFNFQWNATVQISKYGTTVPYHRTNYPNLSTFQPVGRRIPCVNWLSKILRTEFRSFHFRSICALTCHTHQGLWLIFKTSCTATWSPWQLDKKRWSTRFKSFLSPLYLMPRLLFMVWQEIFFLSIYNKRKCVCIEVVRLFTADAAQLQTLGADPLKLSSSFKFH